MTTRRRENPERRGVHTTEGRRAVPDFEVFDKDNVPSRRVPTVTILKARVLSLNWAAFVALDQPSAVELLFDRTERIVGLRGTAVRMRHASFVRWPNGCRNGPFLVSAMAYLDYYDIAAFESRRWRAWMDDGTLCIALDSESESVTRSRLPSDPHDLPQSLTG